MITDEQTALLSGLRIHLHAYIDVVIRQLYHKLNGDEKKPAAIFPNKEKNEQEWLFTDEQLKEMFDKLKNDGVNDGVKKP